MKRGLRAGLGFIAGALAGWSLSIAAYIVLTSAGMLSDRDGGVAMGFAFTIGPFVGLLLGIAAAVRALRR